MPIFHLVREHHYCVEADTEAEARAALNRREFELVRDGDSLSSTTSVKHVRSADEIPDELADASPVGSDNDDTTRVKLNRGE